MKAVNALFILRLLEVCDEKIAYLLDTHTNTQAQPMRIKSVRKIFFIAQRIKENPHNAQDTFS